MNYDDALIYFIEHEHGFVKIGMSKDPERRFNDMKNMCPYNVELRTTIEPVYDVDWSQTLLESMLQSYYSTYRKCGEWFDLPAEELDALEKIQQIKVSDLHTTEVDLLNRQTRDTEETILDHLREAWALNQTNMDGGSA